MTEAISKERLYGLAKKIEADVAHIKAGIEDRDLQFMAVRNLLHVLQGDMLRNERQLAGIGQSLDRIEHRLN
jgi:hypothetical protein